MKLNKLLQPTKEKILISLSLVVVIETYLMNYFGNALAFSGKTALEFKVLVGGMFLIPVFLIVYAIICTLFYDWTTDRIT